MCRNSFVLYTDQKETVEQLSDEEAGKLFKAIYEYNKSNEIILTGVLKAVFMQFKVFLDKDNAKWEETKKKRSEAGKKGMEARWNNITNDNNVITNDNNVMQDITKITVNDNVNVNVNDNVNVNNNINNIMTTTNNIYSYIENNFGITISGTNYEKIEDWLSLYDEKMLCYAVDTCVANGTRTIRYLEGILRNWKGNGYKSLADVIENEEKRTHKKEETIEEMMERIYGKQ